GRAGFCRSLRGESHRAFGGGQSPPPRWANRHADERTVRESKSPGQIFGAADSNSRTGDDAGFRVLVAHEGVARFAAKIQLVMSHRDVECLGQFSRPRTEAMDFGDAAPRLHQRQAAAWFEG